MPYFNPNGDVKATHGLVTIPQLQNLNHPFKFGPPDKNGGQQSNEADTDLASKMPYFDSHGAVMTSGMVSDYDLLQNLVSKKSAYQG